MLELPVRTRRSDLRSTTSSTSCFGPAQRHDLRLRRRPADAGEQARAHGLRQLVADRQGTTGFAQQVVGGLDPGFRLDLGRLGGDRRAQQPADGARGHCLPHRDSRHCRQGVVDGGLHQRLPPSRVDPRVAVGQLGTQLVVEQHHMRWHALQPVTVRLVEAHRVGGVGIGTGIQEHQRRERAPGSRLHGFFPGKDSSRAPARLPTLAARLPAPP